MRGLYLIPDREHLEDSVALRESQGILWEYNDFMRPDILEDKKEQLRIMDIYARTGIDFSRDTMHGAFLDVTLHSTDPLIREVSEKRVRQSMEIAKEMGLRGVVFHTNRIQGFRDKTYLANWLEVNELFFRRLTDDYPGIKIFMENMWDEAPDMMVALAEKMNDVPEFGLCMDYAHVMISGYSPGDWIQECAPYITHIHINDNDQKNDQHLAVGDGEIDWGVLNRGIQTYGVDATVLIEVNGIERQKTSLAYLRKKEFTSILGGGCR